MKIPGTPQRMDNLTLALQNFNNTLSQFSSGLEDVAETFNEAFSNAVSSAFGYDETYYESKARELLAEEYDALSDEEKNNGTMYFIEESEPKAHLIPIICKCCGGRIGRHDTCEYCGTRYII